MATNTRQMSAVFAALGATMLPSLFVPTAAQADPPRDHDSRTHDANWNKDQNYNHNGNRSHDTDRGKWHANYQQGRNQWHGHYDNGRRHDTSTHQDRDRNNRNRDRDRDRDNDRR